MFRMKTIAFVLVIAAMALGACAPVAPTTQAPANTAAPVAPANTSAPAATQGGAPAAGTNWCSGSRKSFSSPAEHQVGASSKSSITVLSRPPRIRGRTYNTYGPTGILPR